MDYKVIVMPQGAFEGLGGRLATETDDSRHKTPCIETASAIFYPDEVEWVYGRNKAARAAAKEAGYKVRNVLGNIMYIDT